MAELQAQRAVATDDAGMSARPHGEEFYRWALKASTTTTMTPDEVHEMGRSELKQPARADGRDPERASATPRARVGERMQALAKDPRYKFAEGDKGRAEIMAFIQDALDVDPARRCRAPSIRVVNPNMEVKRLPPEEEPGAPGAYGGAGSIDGKIPGRFWINLRTTDAAQQVQPRRPDVSRGDSRAHLAGRIHARDAAHPAAAGVQRLLGRVGALRRAARRRTRRVRERSASGGSAICSRLRSAPAASSSTPASTPSAGRASRACSSSSR